MISRIALISADPAVSLAIWLGVVIQAGALLLWGWLILPRRRARPSAVLASVLIGLSFAPAASILLLNVCEMLGANRVIAAAFVEEPVKAAAVVIVLLMLRPALHGPVDGLIIGFFVGFGFAVIEDVLYTAGASNAQGAWLLVVTRAITQLGGHALWTAIIGAALAYVIVAGGRRWGLVLAAFAFAILLHLTWNTVGALVGGPISIAVTVVVVAVTIVAFFRVRRWSVEFENRVDA
jgi:RsiW-degrading membrane proteinase PrsW (M82 family)